MQGKFVSIEGIDGSGKSTTSRHLTQLLRENGIDAIALEKKSRLSGESFLSQHMSIINTALWEYPKNADISLAGDRHWLHLIAAWYSVLDTAILRPNLESGKWVVCDGWVYKYLARFSIKPHIGEAFASACFESLTIPDHVFFLDIDPELSFERRSAFQPSELGAFDGIKGDDRTCYVTYQNQVRKMYLEHCHRNRWQKIDSSKISSLDLSREIFTTMMSK